MEIAETRRILLKKWFEDRTIPPKEKSYLSQLMTGTASFGERAARRLEKDYGMGHLYLDGGKGQLDDVVTTNADTLTLVQLKTPTPAEEVDLMWVTPLGRKILTLLHGTDDAGRASILRAAEAVPRVMKPAAVRNKK